MDVIVKLPHPRSRDSGFKEIISGVPQGSTVGPILFNAFLNDFFYDIENASVHNFADDNTPCLVSLKQSRI